MTTHIHPQEQTVLKHLQEVGSISGLEASSLYRITSLTKRISNLRKGGYDNCIVSEWRKDHTQKRYKRYYWLNLDS